MNKNCFQSYVTEFELFVLLHKSQNKSRMVLVNQTQITKTTRCNERVLKNLPLQINAKKVIRSKKTTKQILGSQTKTAFPFLYGVSG